MNELKRPCETLGLSDLNYCINFGSSDCPITMEQDIDCELSMDDLKMGVPGYAEKMIAKECNHESS